MYSANFASRYPCAGLHYPAEEQAPNLHHMLMHCGEFYETYGYQLITNTFPDPIVIVTATSTTITAASLSRCALCRSGRAYADSVRRVGSDGQ